MKNKILNYLFPSYIQNIKDNAESVANTKFEAYKATLDIKDLIRERYKGVRIGISNSSSILEEHLSSLKDKDSRLAFLSEAHKLTENKAFKIISDSISEESMYKAAMIATDMRETNFNRATINGIMLLEDEAETLSGMYLKEKEENPPLTPEEQQEIISS